MVLSESIRDELSGTSPPQDRAPVEELAEDYLRRRRQGERPAISEYVARYPELAAEIRDLFPAVMLLEDFGPANPKLAAPGTAGSLVDQPAQLGEYRVLREIGRGGMGIVLEAEHATLQRRVALKVLSPELAAKPSHLHRFLREARAAGRLHHTNIVPVFEVGVHGGTHFYAMQYIHGQNLDAVIDEVRRIRQRRSDAPPESDPRPAGGSTEPMSLNRTLASELLETGFHAARRAVAARMAAASREAAASRDAAGVRAAGAVPTREAKPRFISRPDTLDGGSATASPGNSNRDPAGQSSVDAATELSSVGGANETYYQRVARIGLQVTEALAYAHRQGLLHRDIKPANLILDTDGVVWVTDFGLAKDEGDDFTHTGDIVGTLRYMAPERLQGLADARSDIYGLGLTLYELATLESAFGQRDRAALVRQIECHEPTPPRRIDSALPRDLETIILKAMEKSPGRRYRSACQMGEDLRLFLADRPIQARRNSLLERAWRWCRRNPGQAVSAACITCLLAVVVAGALAFGLVNRQQAQLLRQENQRALRAESSAREAESQALHRLYESTIAHAQAARWSRRPGQHFAGLKSLARGAEILTRLNLAPAEEQAERLLLRKEAIACLPLLDVRPLKTWTVTDGWTAAVAFDKEYEHYAQSDDRGNVAVRRVANDHEIRWLEGPGVRGWVLEFSPDGNFLAGKFHQPAPDFTPVVVWVWDVAAGNTVLRLETDLSAAAFAFHPSSRQIAVAMQDSAVRIFALPEGRLLRQRRVAPEPQRVGWSTAGDRLALVNPTGPALQIWHVANGEIQDLPGTSQSSSLDWSDDDQWLAVGRTDGNIDLWSVQPQPKRADRLEGHVANVVSVRFNHRGDRLVSKSWDGTTRFWDLTCREEVLQLDHAEVSVAEFHGDDQALAFQEGPLRFGIWQVSQGGPLQILHNSASPQSPSSVAFHPTEPRLLAVARRDTVEFWDAEAGRLLQSLPCPSVAQALFEPGGGHLLVSNSQGLVRWPLTTGPHLQSWQIGAPQTLLSAPLRRFALNSAGSLAAVHRGGTKLGVLDLAQAGQYAAVGSHPNLDRVALDPNGRWLVTTTWQGRGMHLWDVGTGQFVQDLSPDSLSAAAAFSPDGNYLAGSDGYSVYLWQTSSWKLLWKRPREHPDGWPGTVEFSADGTLLAVPHTRYIAELVDPADGTTLGVLTPPRLNSLTGYAFSGDGRYLAVAETNRVQLWRLDELDQQLRGLGLHWEAGPTP